MWNDKFGQPGAAVEAVLSGGSLPREIAAEWLAADGQTIDMDLLAAARRLTAAVHGPRIRIFAPLYYSNRCANNCLYCGFRRDNPDARRRVLSLEEIENETRALLLHGHRRILLVASEDPSPAGRSLALDAVRRARAVRLGDSRIEQLAVEIAPGEVDDFRALAAAGVDAYVLFQETYDPEIYARVHPDGPKRDYDFRLGAPERALEGGIRHVGLGVLLGLGEPVQEILSLIDHARRIEAAFGRPPRTVSLPRMEPAGGSPLSREPYRRVSDTEMLRSIAVLRLALPGCGIVLSTRESSVFRDTALDWGVTEMSVGSRTDPGGYTAADDGCLAQFELHDHRSVPEMIRHLRSRGYEPYVGSDPSSVASPEQGR